jgi:hypothetical protein
MGIERFYTESIGILAFSPSGTYPFDDTWTAITGSPFNGAFTELSGARADVGGASEVRADAMVCLPTSVPVLSKYHVTYDSKTYEIVNIKKLPEKAGHHQEIYLKEYRV